MRREAALRFFDGMTEEMKHRIDAGIEENRKGNALLDACPDGQLLPEGTPVEAELVNHAFRFGANLFMLDEMESDEKNRIYREKFAELFNLATVPFYWSDLEPEKGKPRYDKDSPKVYRRPATDLCLEYCREKNIEPKCHCLNYDKFVPTWLRGADPAEMKKALSAHFREIAERYADQIPSFEVTNETLSSKYLSSFFMEDDFVEWSWREAEKYFPNNRLIINEYRTFSPCINNRNFYYLLLERLFNEGITHLDTIGFQFHTFQPREAEAKVAAARYNPDFMLSFLDLFSRFGRKMQLTEMTIPAYSDAAEDEEIQADLLVNLFKMFFSHKSMDSIVYWNLVDGYAAFAPQGDMTVGENLYYGGLLRFDMSEKPAFRALKKLIREEWHTKVSSAVQGGKIAFRGFYGDYRITAHLPEGDKVFTYTLKPED